MLIFFIIGGILIGGKPGPPGLPLATPMPALMHLFDFISLLNILCFLPCAWVSQGNNGSEAILQISCAMCIGVGLLFTYFFLH